MSLVQFGRTELFCPIAAWQLVGNTYYCHLNTSTGCYWQETSTFFKMSPFSRDDTLVPYLPFDNFHRSLFQCEKLLLAEAAQHHKGYSYSDLKNISQPCEPQSFPHIICGPFPHSWCLTLFLLTLAQQEAQYNGLVVKQSLVTARYSQFPDKA